MNVAQTYLEMSIEQGLSKREAIKQVCDSIGLKFASSYAVDWPDDSKSRPIPPAAVKEMQQRSALYSAAKAGIDATEEKALLFAELLSPKAKIQKG